MKNIIRHRNELLNVNTSEAFSIMGYPDTGSIVPIEASELGTPVEESELTSINYILSFDSDHFIVIGNIGYPRELRFVGLADICAIEFESETQILTGDAMVVPFATTILTPLNPKVLKDAYGYPSYVTVWTVRYELTDMGYVMDILDPPEPPV